MIEGASDVTRMFNMLKRLGVVKDDVDITQAATYAISYKGQDMRIPLSGEYVEEEANDEEVEIIFICEHGVDAWLEKMDNILLGDEDE